VPLRTALATPLPAVGSDVGVLLHRRLSASYVPVNGDVSRCEIPVICARLVGIGTRYVERETVMARELYRVLFVGGPANGHEVIVPHLYHRYRYPTFSLTGDAAVATIDRTVITYEPQVGPMDLPSIDDRGRYVYLCVP